ncbi:MAG: cell division protein SepF [Lachnospiraceae bacterium]|nr:cell division protein SepF [Lachnospiraceae bacterium]
MGILTKIRDSVLLNDEDYEDDDEYTEDGYDDDDEYDDTEKKGIFKSLRLKKEYDYDEPDEEEYKPVAKKVNKKVVPMRSKKGNNMEVCIIKPSSIDDGKEIASTLVNGIVVVLNLEGIQIETAQRIIDFASGACFAINGKMQKISNFFFIATPNNVDISGDVQEILNNNADMSDY